MTAGNHDVHTWLTALAITADIEDEFEVSVDDALTWDHPTVDALSTALSELVGEKRA